MDSQNEDEEIQAAQAKVHRAENEFNENQDEVTNFLAGSYPQRTRALTEKGLEHWIESRDVRRKNQDRYRYIIEGHIVRIYDILKTSEGIDMIDELLEKVTHSYKDYTRQFDSKEEQMSDPLFLQTFNKVKVVQQDIQSWKANADAASVSRAKPNSIKSGSSEFSRKLKLSKSSHNSCRTIDDVIKNRTKLATLQARAQYFEKEKQVELELDRTRLEKEIAIAKATEKIHQEYLNDDYELNSLNAKDIQYPKISEDVIACSYERKPVLSQFHEDCANTKKQSFLAASYQHSQTAPMFSTQARCKFEKANLQSESTQFHPTVAHSATTSLPDPFIPPIPNPGPTPTPLPAPFGDERNEMLYHLFEKQGEYIRQQGLPHVAPETFTGDILKYKMFITLFDMNVDSRISNPKEKLAVLIEYTSGEPRSLIETCLYQPPEFGYSRARELLEKHYGNPIQVANSHIERLISWPKIYDNDSKKMREFYIYLVKCQGCLSDEEYVHELNTSSLLQTLSLKLQERLQRQWATHVYIIKSTKMRRANFGDFVEFIGKESEVASDPTFSKEAMSKIVSKRPFNSFRTQRDVGKSRITSLVTKSRVTNSTTDQKSNAAEKTINAKVMNTIESDLECPCCKEKHCLDSCQIFMNRSPFARKMFVISHKLCFGCYSPSHCVTDCTQKLACRRPDCGMSHPTGMHGTHRFKGKAKTSTNDVSLINNGCTKCDDPNKVSAEVLSLSVLPMLLWHKSNPNHVIKVYGMLDNCSQGTFIQRDILANLDAPKVNTKIAIKTITGIIKEDADIVKDLVVSSLDGRNQIDLPKVFSRQDLPIDRNEIPTPERVRSWSYLKEIVDEIPDLDCDIPLGLLIGVNCPAALRPTEVIKEENGGPFAQKTAFGWCIVGPLLNGHSTDSMKCNRIAVADVTTNRCSQHYFAVQNEVRDVNAATVLIDMYRKEFNEPTPKEMKNKLLKGVCPPESTTEKLLTRSSLQQYEQSISKEDEKFLIKVEREVILVDGHYQLPLPFRKDDVKMPNNRKQAEQRAHWIKKKFGNKQFREDYVTFMNGIISKGYAREVPKANMKIDEGKTWYLPHHGIYHPNKPGKIRVVFDCSCNYKGTSLNEELLQGPNLTNSLVGILARFRSKPVAVMADIEAMFYQVYVPENQRSFLRFLWWPNGNTDECLAEYEMCVHIFGAVSSPACEKKEIFEEERYSCSIRSICRPVWSFKSGWPFEKV